MLHVRGGQADQRRAFARGLAFQNLDAIDRSKRW